MGNSLDHREEAAMAWQETHVMDERLMFIGEWLTGERRMAELCRRYGVSRRTGYKFIDRYVAEGPEGLKDRSRAPHHHANAIDQEREEAILALRAAHPSWGPKKLKAWLERKRCELVWPAQSTIAEMLDRHGLVRRRKLRRHGAPQLTPLTSEDAANRVWGMDFKGWFRTGDGERCDPFSLSDLASRYVLRLQALDKPDGEHVWPILEAAFGEFGLPETIRSDNGPPFASLAAGGLSWLAVRLIKAGVKPERIAAGKPQQNGRHERLHRTLKQETAQPPAASRRAQQRRFDEFRRTFNDERPHEALGQDTPAAHYQRSPRSYSGRLHEPDYPTDYEVRRVRHNGDIKWRGGRIFLSEALIGEPVGIAETDEDIHLVYYGPIHLGRLDRAGGFRKAAPRSTETPKPPT
jgi:transposase InsO family protein